MLNACAVTILYLVATTSTVDSHFGSDHEFSKCAKVEFSDVVSLKSSCRSKRSTIQDITEDILEGIFQNLDTSLQGRRELEKKLANSGRVISKRKSDLSLTRNVRLDPLIKEMEYGNLVFEIATNELYKKYNLTSDILSDHLPKVILKGTLASYNKDICTKKLASARCDRYSKYRLINGLCNNLQNLSWGSALACQQRMLKPNYVGASGFAVSVDGSPLPEPRDISLNVHYHINRPTNYVTHIYPFFGQFLAHDMVHTPESTTVDNQAIECCPPEEETHPQCAPLRIRRNDPFYSKYNVTCMNFVRSVACPTCSLGPRQLMNQATSTIDASVVYANVENTTNSLRENDGTGRLKVQRTEYGDLLPKSFRPQEDRCSYPETNDICFEAGDFRANQHNVLTSLHTIFVREHNRIASQLHSLNPRWNDEIIFQEARRIVGAEMQVITYKEFLPITIGEDRMSYFKLWPGRWTRYDPNENPTTLVEFATAALHIGHTLINSIVTNYPPSETNEPRYLRNEFFQPFELYRGLITPLMQGASKSPAQFFDRYHVPDITNYLYKLRDEQTGLDLAAITIQRSRDHGLPTYVTTVRHCSDGEINIKSFNDLLKYNLMNPEQVHILQRNYKYVQDIELPTGIFCENYLKGAVVGPTAACILGTQFYKSKYGDRFYFEHANEAGSFTSKQLEEIHKVTLSEIICLNTGAKQMQRTAMLFPSQNNPYIDCNYMKGVDLSYWKQ